MTDATPIGGFFHNEEPAPSPWRVGPISGWRTVEVRRGGMGEVYICAPAEGDPDFRIALKTTASHLLFHRDVHRAFARESVMWMRLSMVPVPLVMPALGIVHTDRTYVIMPVAEGEAFSLQHVIDRGSLPLERILRIAWEISFALTECGRAVDGFTHGDLKPSNVLMLQGRAYVSDFGLARCTAQAAGSSFSGTPPYRAPELADGRRPPDLRSDLYAFGVILRQLIAAGEQAQDPLRSLAEHCADDDPASRPTSFATVVDELERLGEMLRIVLPEATAVRHIFAVVPGALRQGVWMAGSLRALCRLGEPELVIEEAEQIPARERLPEVWLSLGVALSMTGRDDEALDCFEQAEALPLRADLTSELAANRGLSLKRVGRLEEAIRVFWQALRAAKGKDVAILSANLAGVYLAAERVAEAHQVIDTALIDHPELPELHRTSAEIHRVSGDKAAARGAAATAASLAPADPHTHEQLAEILLDDDDAEGALTAIGSAFTFGGRPLRALSRTLALALLRGDGRTLERVRALGAEHLDAATLTEVEKSVSAALAAPDVPEKRPLPPAATPPMPRPDASLAPWTLTTSPDPSAILLSSIPPESRTDRVYRHAALSPDGLLSLDHYQPINDVDVVDEFAAGYREVLADPGLRMRGRMSSAPFVLVRCPQCASDILTNRSPGKRFVCRRCGGAAVAEHVPSAVAERVNERVGQTFRDNSHLVGLLVEVADETMLREAMRIAEEQGWRPLPSDAHFSRRVRAEALSRGMADLASAAFFACREGTGRPVGERLTDPSTEALLASLRKRFGRFRSFSMAHSIHAGDPVSLMMAGRSAEAEQLLTERSADAGDAPAWILLSDGALRRGHLETAERAARTAVRLAPDLGESWHALAEVELARGRPADALAAAVRAAERAPSFVSAHRVKLVCARRVGDTGRAAEAEAHLRHLGITPDDAASKGPGH